MGARPVRHRLVRTDLHRSQRFLDSLRFAFIISERFAGAKGTEFIKFL